VVAKNSVGDISIGVSESGDCWLYTGYNKPISIYTNGRERMQVASNGNVLIGTTDDNGAKLQVNGGISATALGQQLNSTWTDSKGNNRIWYGLDFSKLSDSISLAGYYGLLFKTAPTAKTIFDGGGVEINGDLHVTGNIIADGEVSAGGRAEEGGNAGSGAGAFHSESIAVGATQTTIAHGLGTDDIVVSIYEKDGVSGRWSIILPMWRL
jgi:hypothetical protein